jgi:hypothetical protein
MRQSKVILHDDEIRAQMEAESKPRADIDAAIAERQATAAKAQAAYDKVPPAPAYRKTPE